MKLGASPCCSLPQKILDFGVQGFRSEARQADACSDISTRTEHPRETFVQKPRTRSSICPSEEYEVISTSEESSGGWTDEEWREWKSQLHGKH